MFFRYESNLKPITYFPLLTKHLPQCFKINNYTTHIILHRWLTNVMRASGKEWVPTHPSEPMLKLSLFFLPCQPESTIPDQIHFF